MPRRPGAVRRRAAITLEESGGSGARLPHTVEAQAVTVDPKKDPA